MTEMITVSERDTKLGRGSRYTNDVLSSRHALTADEPEALGGADMGPTPFEYLAAGLGSCTTITLRMYADRKKWPMDHVSVDVSQSRDDDGTHVFIRTLTIQGDLDDTQRARLHEIADKCPVHKVLSNGNRIETKLS